MFYKNKLSIIVSAVIASIGTVGAVSAADLQDVYNSTVINGAGSIDFEGQETVQFNGDESYSGVEAWHGGTSEIKNVGTIILGGTAWQGGAFYAIDNATINVTEGIENLITDPEGEYCDANLIHSHGSTINISVTDTIDISNVYNGVYSQRPDNADYANLNSNVNLTAGDSIRISADTAVVSANYNDEGNDDGYAKVTINANKVELVGTDGYGISARSAQYTDKIEYNDAYAGKASVVVNAKDRLVVQGSEGAVFASNGKDQNDVSVELKAAEIFVKGDMNIDKKAQLVVGDASADFTATIDGDVNATNSANVDLNLGNGGSFTGAVNNDASTVSLDLGKSSQWNVTGASNVTTVTGDGTMILESKETTVDIGQLNGSLTAGFAGLTADDFTDAAKEVGDIITVGESTEGSTLTTKIAKGDLYDAVTITTKDGETTVTGGGTSNKLEAFQGVTASAMVQWRNQINHITKRLGDIRMQPAGLGAWARVYGGEYEWGERTTVDMTSTTVQAGADGRIGDWIVGGAFSYTDSRFDISNGDADGDMYSFAVYASRQFERGSYVDIVGRYGYIQNEMTAGNMDIDMDSNAFSVSVEGGHQFRFMEKAYVEPQLEFAYGFVEGADDTASIGVKVDQDDYQSLTTRIGVRAGFDFPEDAGTIYAHVNYTYDFLGDADATATKAGVRPVDLDEDLGGGWVTYGIGTQFKIGGNTFAYGDIERSTGGDVENPWAFNIGVRHLF